MVGGSTGSSGSGSGALDGSSSGSRNIGRSGVGEHRFNGLDGFYGGSGAFYEQNPTHRVEVIAACLVVVFGVLLLAAVVLVCLLRRRPLATSQHNQRPGGQSRLSYTCTPLWNCQWSLFKHQKAASNSANTVSEKRLPHHYVQAQNQELLNDPRFSDAQSIESSMVKGMMSTDSITNALEEEKKPLYYDVSLKQSKTD